MDSKNSKTYELIQDKETYTLELNLSKDQTPSISFKLLNKENAQYKNSFNYDNLVKLFNYKDENENPNCILEVEQPNKNIYEINGSILFYGDDKNKNYFNFKNTAIRGAKLKNTEYIYGIINGNEWPSSSVE